MYIDAGFQAVSPWIAAMARDLARGEDFAARLNRLGLPLDFSGKSVLDLACGEGDLCAEMIERGAARVVGCGADANAREIASRRAPLAEWRLAPPDEKFDFVFYSAPLDERADGRAIFTALLERLTPVGVLVVECAALPDLTTKAWVSVPAIAGATRAPTFRLVIDDLLEGYAAREVWGEQECVDVPIARFTLHCRPLKPVLLVIGGDPMRGKTTLARLLMRERNTPIHTDFWLEDVQARANEIGTPFARYIAAHVQRGRIRQFTDKMVEDGYLDEFCVLLLSETPRGAPLTVIEGYAFSYPKVRDAFYMAATNAGFRVVFLTL
ncbi:MAG: methyltransferase domain-containing protein [Caulobacterales bacterium]